MAALTDRVPVDFTPRSFLSGVMSKLWDKRFLRIGMKLRGSWRSLFWRLKTSQSSCIVRGAEHWRFKSDLFAVLTNYLKLVFLGSAFALGLYFDGPGFLGGCFEGLFGVVTVNAQSSNSSKSPSSINFVSKFYFAGLAFFTVFFLKVYA